MLLLILNKFCNDFSILYFIGATVVREKENPSTQLIELLPERSQSDCSQSSTLSHSSISLEGKIFINIYNMVAI